MEWTLTLTLEVSDDLKNVSAHVFDGESGTGQTIENFFSPDEHPEFNDAIGNEIYSWFSLMADEIKASKQEVETEAVEACPHCGHENVYKNHNVNRGGYMAVCENCGRVIMLCDECQHADDNPDQHCDWCRACDYGICKRGITKYED